MSIKPFTFCQTPGVQPRKSTYYAVSIRLKYLWRLLFLAFQLNRQFYFQINSNFLNLTKCNLLYCLSLRCNDSSSHQFLACTRQTFQTPFFFLKKKKAFKLSYGILQYVCMYCDGVLPSSEIYPYEMLPSSIPVR